MLDTSTVILLGDVADPRILPDESVISAITLAELSVGPHVAGNDEERAARQQHLQQAEADFEVLPFDTDCARAFGGVEAALRASGQNYARSLTQITTKRALLFARRPTRFLCATLFLATEVIPEQLAIPDERAGPTDLP